MVADGTPSIMNASTRLDFACNHEDIPDEKEYAVAGCKRTSYEAYQISGCNTDNEMKQGYLLAVSGTPSIMNASTVIIQN